eukprot:EG_transcript_15828
MLLSVKQLRLAIAWTIGLSICSAALGFIALGLPYWSDVRVAGAAASGTVNVGLWGTCSTVGQTTLCVDQYLQDDGCHSLYRAVQALSVAGAVIALVASCSACCTAVLLTNVLNYMLRAVLTVFCFLAFLLLSLTWLMWMVLAQDTVCGEFLDYGPSYWIEVASSVLAFFAFCLGITSCFLTSDGYATVLTAAPELVSHTPELVPPPDFVVSPRPRRVSGPSLSPMVAGSFGPEALELDDIDPELPPLGRHKRDPSPLGSPRGVTVAPAVVLGEKLNPQDAGFESSSPSPEFQYPRWAKGATAPGKQVSVYIEEAASSSNFPADGNVVQHPSFQAYPPASTRWGPSYSYPNGTHTTYSF